MSDPPGDPVDTTNDQLAARRAGLALAPPASLDRPLSDSPDDAALADILGGDDPRIEVMLGMEAVAAHWGELPEREQAVLVLRFRDGLSQRQLAQRVGLSQMQVCRLLGHALGYLRGCLLG